MLDYVSQGKPLSDWFAVFVLTGDEENVKQRIQYRFNDTIKVMVPKRKLRERKGGSWIYRIRPLFPGYILINGKLSTNELCNFKGIPGLVRILGNKGEPYQIDFDEMSVISKLICNDDTIGFSRILVENEKVTVVEGPLVSLEGMIISIDKRKGRAKVRLSLLGEDRIVELGISTIQPLNSERVG